MKTIKTTTGLVQTMREIRDKYSCEILPMSLT